MSMNSVEILGTVSSVVVAVSLTMKNIRWLRAVNLVGASSFCLYGVLIGSFPVWGLNAFIVAINAYYLLRLAFSRDAFSVLEVPPGGAMGKDSLAGQFLRHYGADIQRFQPRWDPSLIAGSRVVFLLREVLPVSVMVCRAEDAFTQRIVLDYAIPAWRDYRTARFFFGGGFETLNWGATRRFVTTADTNAHRRYLAKLGFRPIHRLPGADWLLELPARGQ